MKMFRIYDGRNKFWQWDSRQKLIVSNNDITEVRFEIGNSRTTKRRIVYTNAGGQRVCDVPDVALQNHTTLSVYGCIGSLEGMCSTVGVVKFAVLPQSRPEEYVGTDVTMEDILTRLVLLGNQIRDVEESSRIKKFNTENDATDWASEYASTAPGTIVVIRIDNEWIAHVVNDDLTVSPICNIDDEMITVNFDGGNAFGVHTD